MKPDGSSKTRSNPVNAGETLWNKIQHQVKRINKKRKKENDRVVPRNAARASDFPISVFFVGSAEKNWSD